MAAYQIDEDVVRFEIRVHDAFGVEEGHSDCYFEEKLDGEFWRVGFGGEIGLEGAAGVEFGDEEGRLGSVAEQRCDFCGRVSC